MKKHKRLTKLELYKSNKKGKRIIYSCDQGHYGNVVCSNCGQDAENNYVKCSKCGTIFTSTEVDDNNMGGSDF